MLIQSNGDGHGFSFHQIAQLRKGLDLLTPDPLTSTNTWNLTPHDTAATSLSDFSDSDSDVNNNSCLGRISWIRHKSRHHSHISPDSHALVKASQSNLYHHLHIIISYITILTAYFIKLLIHFICKNLVIIIRCTMSGFLIWYRRSWKRHILLFSFMLLIFYFAMWISQVHQIEIPDIQLDEKDIDHQLKIDKKPQIVTYVDPKKKRTFLKTGVKEILGQDVKVNEDVIEKYETKRKLKYHRIWQWADRAITIHELFPDTPDIETVLEALRTAPIVNVDVLDMGQYESGTSEKWIATLEGGQKVIIKLIWEHDSKGRQKAKAECNFGHEMPSSEIAAFHLLRILGMRNTPYVSGRRINIETEILPVASPAVVKQIILEPGNRTCVRGKCYHCKAQQLLCPKNGIVETSIAYWIPRHLKLLTYPPKYMPYSTPNMDNGWGNIGLNNRTYCKKIQDTMHPYEIDRYYHDLIDFAVVDSLMYHYDTKHYLIYDHSDAHGLSVRLDHGRAFCSWEKDELHVFLAPLHQCCTLRWSTYLALDGLRKKKELSKQLKHLLSKDPLAPILREPWYASIERRLQKILKTIDECAKANGGNVEKILVG